MLAHGQSSSPFCSRPMIHLSRTKRHQTWRLLLLLQVLGRPSSSCSSPLRGRRCCCRTLPPPPPGRKQLPYASRIVRYVVRSSLRAQGKNTTARIAPLTCSCCDQLVVQIFRRSSTTAWFRGRYRCRRATSLASATTASPTCWGTIPAREAREGN
jgi:hypothetical protein